MVRIVDAKADIVARMPRRMAHALHALLVACDEQKAPAYAHEVVVYDGEALSARATAAALREAQKRGYCANARGVWVVGNRAYELRTALEERYLRETDEDGKYGDWRDRGHAGG